MRSFNGSSVALRRELAEGEPSPGRHIAPGKCIRSGDPMPEEDQTSEAATTTTEFPRRDEQHEVNDWGMTPTLTAALGLDTSTESDSTTPVPVQRKARELPAWASLTSDDTHHDSERALAAASSSMGTALPSTQLQKFESSLGTDLSKVRVHSGSASGRAAEAVGAKAYAVGNDIHFGTGNYNPSSADGERLLAHEVAHTVQQQGGTAPPQFKLAISSPGSPLEDEADRAADAMIEGEPATVSSYAPTIARSPAPAASGRPTPRVRELEKNESPRFMAKGKPVRQCNEYAPQLLAQFRDRPPSYLDDLLPPRDPEELKRLFAERAAQDSEDVIVELPLGGWIVGKRKDVEQIARHEETQIGIRTLDAVRSSISGTLAATIARANGDSAIVVMKKAEAATAIEGALTAAGKTKRAANQLQISNHRELARGAPLEPQPHRSSQPLPTLPAPAGASSVSPPDPENQRIRLGRPARGSQTLISPGVPVPKSQRVPRDLSLKDDLKLRSVPTFLDGSSNPKFDPFTPSFIAGHFKFEQRRTGSDNPRDWLNPKGYDAQHPNGRPYAIYGEPPGTCLTWGTIEDNRKLQKPREFGQTPHLPEKPIPE